MFNVITAVNYDDGIGYNGDLTIHDKADMQHFKETTLNKVVVMGIGTWNSINRRFLKDRINIVIVGDGTMCSDTGLEKYKEKYKNVLFFRELDEVVILCLKLFINLTDVYIIGGSKIYELALEQDLAFKIIMTRFDEKDKKSDKFFPDIDSRKFERKYINHKKCLDKILKVHVYTRDTKDTRWSLLTTFCELIEKYGNLQPLNISAYDILNEHTKNNIIDIKDILHFNDSGNIHKCVDDMFLDNFKIWDRTGYPRIDIFGV